MISIPDIEKYNSPIITTVVNIYVDANSRASHKLLPQPELDLFLYT